jgi:hypothetical protein
MLTSTPLPLLMRRRNLAQCLQRRDSAAHVAHCRPNLPGHEVPGNERGY